MKKQSENKANLIELFSKFKFFAELVELIDSGKNGIKVKQLNGSSKAVLVASLHQQLNNPILVLSADHRAADDWFDDLSNFVSDEFLSLIAADSRKKYLKDTDLDNNLSSMIDGLNKATNNQKSLLITNPEVLLKEIPKPSTIQASKIKIACGDTVSFSEFTKSFMLNGFQKEFFVSEPGEIAIRGGIVDIYPIGFSLPLRIEFWGDEIESIREFEPLSQRSVREYREVEIIDNLFDLSSSETTSSLFEFLREDTIIIIDQIETFAEDVEIDSYLSNFKTIYINSLGSPDIEIHSETQPKFNSLIMTLRDELKRLEELDYKVLIASNGKIHLDRLKDLVENTFTPDEFDKKTELEDAFFLENILWQDSSLSAGFVLPSQKIAYYTEHEIFARQRIKQNVRSKKSQGLTLKEIKQLNIGDFVVHEDKGIGKFDGFQTIVIGGNKQDCMRIFFAEGDLLYVHLNYIHKVQKYSAGDSGSEPKLTKLGSSEWLRKKAKTKRKLKDIARDLIMLYSLRKKSKGFAYPSDDVWQKEFEASFFYEDTPDQAQTTDDVKKDMMSEVPMDRLICGDVGFGKTEIAIRAAFKAATSGKQTAVLVPTTILAQQHYTTFKDRIGRYPVSVDVISRFRSKKEQDEVIEKLKAGKVDILIGTHRLLSKDLSFKNLGLLVIDEEHRFGVGAKEKLRQLKQNVDTLTLTATPIPRTLNFSLMGARDLSLIETPPRNRLPVETEIVEFDAEFMALAIEKEIGRGGQVFFVSDRVKGLEKLASDLSMLLPSMKYGIAHGQMTTKQLELVMEKFTDRKFDVLFATKIIESGIDIPNANTMIINNANNFGLAELYQLRGRVGRADIQAYCYLAVSKVRSLSRLGLQRLQAIEEFTDLGSGLKLAMRDLEIRGAGNLLGAEQSGFIIEMGFDLFQKILDEAVHELRTEEFQDVFVDEQQGTPQYLKNDDIQIEIGSDAYFPDNYMSNATDRFNYYKRLYNVAGNKELEELISEIQDRFGKLPDSARALVAGVRVRLAAIDTGFVRVVLRQSRLVAEFPAESNDLYYKNIFPGLVEYLNTIEGAKLNQARTKLLLEIPISGYNNALEILWKIKNTVKLLIE